ncbi:MAG: HipA domain-containing protein [Clostridiales bacterium]|nr:HipA domain-containing protein [Clostridiales bacterium]
MTDIQKEMLRLEKELSSCPIGYISTKIIYGRERLYLQWREKGKIRSRYIKEKETDEIRALVEKRKQIQKRLKGLKSTQEGKQSRNHKRTAERNTKNLSGKLMLENRVVATVKNGVITSKNDKLIPLYFKYNRYIEGWIASRAIDGQRTNARLLKKALRIHHTDDLSTSLAVNAATITDRYWFKPDGSELTYKDIRFTDNKFDKLALFGDPDAFCLRPSRTPELTNTGSFEKCWKLIDGEWWMYKSGNENEIFSELFICRLGEKLGLDMAHYELDGKYIRTKDFTDSGSITFEPMKSIVGDNEDYKECFDALHEISGHLVMQYINLLWMDSICYNMDRHTENFGVIRDLKTGDILSLAPNYDNNIALISQGYPSNVSRDGDGLIRFFREFMHDSVQAREMCQRMTFPEITKETINECLDEIPIEVNRQFITDFILNGQEKMNEIISMKYEENQEEDFHNDLILQ